jgi:DNA-binding transcriptional LysR family regulator
VDDMIDVRRLQVLRVLQQQGTVTGVAQALHLTPSAVSQQIRLLSRDLGVDLLQRHGRRIRLTPAAESLIAYADDLYAGWERMVIALRDAGTDDQVEHLRVCGFPTAVAGLLAPAAARLRHTRPVLTVQISEAETPECYARLLAGDADVAIVVPTSAGAADDRASLDQERLVDDPFDLLVPAEHPLARRGAVDLAETADEAWIALPESLDQHRLVQAAWLAAGFTPRVTHTAKEWDAVIALVGHGFGVSLIPRLAPLPAHQAVVRLPLRGEPAPFRRVFTVVRRGSRRQAGIEAVCAALDQVATELPPQLVDLPDGPGHDDGPGARPHRHTQRDR